MPRSLAVKATPFDWLLGFAPPGALPTTRRQVVVVDGKPVTDVRQIDQAVGQADVAGDRDEARVQELRQAVKRARNQARYQAKRAKPGAVVKRPPSDEAKREAQRAYMRAYRDANRERIRELHRNWARRLYHQDAALAAGKRRDEYHAAREQERARAKARYQRDKVAILARAAVKRAAKQAAKRAADLAAPAPKAAPANPFTTPPPTKKDSAT